MNTSAEYCMQPKQEVQTVLKSGSITTSPSVKNFWTFFGRISKSCFKNISSTKIFSDCLPMEVTSMILTDICREWSFVKYRYPKLKANNEDWAAEPQNSNCILLFQNQNKRQPRKGNQVIKKGSIGREYPVDEFHSWRFDSKPEKVAPWYILATNLSLSYHFQIRTIESILKSFTVSG